MAPQKCAAPERGHIQSTRGSIVIFLVIFTHIIKISITEGRKDTHMYQV